MTAATAIPHAERSAAASLLTELVRIESVNPDLDPAGSGERRLAEFCREHLERRGIRAWLEEARPGRPNTIAEVGAGAGGRDAKRSMDRDAARNADRAGPTLVLCAHLDTVSTTGMEGDPLDGRVEGDRLYGRGSYDMKGGVASILLALERLHERGIAGRVLAALVCDEEVASAGAFDFVRRCSADACILTEPSEERLVLAHKGFAWYEVTCRGRAAHGSRFDLGESAIARAARVVTALDAFDRDVLRSRSHPLTGPASLHVSRIAGGEGMSTYAAECVVGIERRTIPGEDADAVHAEVARVVRSVDPDAEIEMKLVRDPATTPPDSEIARCVRDAAARTLGAPPPDAGVAYWMDAAVFDAAGIPTVDLGAVGAGAHAAEEWVSVESVARCARIYHDAAVAFCEEGGGAARGRSGS